MLLAMRRAAKLTGTINITLSMLERCGTCGSCAVFPRTLRERFTFNLACVAHANVIIWCAII